MTIKEAFEKQEYRSVRIEDIKIGKRLFRLPPRMEESEYSSRHELYLLANSNNILGVDGLKIDYLTRWLSSARLYAINA